MRSLLLCGLVTFCMLFNGVTDSPASASLKHARMAIDSSSRFPHPSSTAHRFGLVVLQSFRTKELHQLKQANPRLKVLMYANLSFMAAEDAWGNSSTGVFTQQADKHPTWYL